MDCVRLLSWHREQLLPGPGLSASGFAGQTDSPISTACCVGLERDAHYAMLSYFLHKDQDVIEDLQEGLWAVLCDGGRQVLFIVVLSPSMTEPNAEEHHIAAKNALLSAACLLSGCVVFSVGGTIDPDSSYLLSDLVLHAALPLHQPCPDIQPPHLVIAFHGVQKSSQEHPGAAAEALLDLQVKQWAGTVQQRLTVHAQQSGAKQCRAADVAVQLRRAFAGPAAVVFPPASAPQLATTAASRRISTSSAMSSRRQSVKLVSQPSVGLGLPGSASKAGTSLLTAQLQQTSGLKSMPSTALQGTATASCGDAAYDAALTELRRITAATPIKSVRGRSMTFALLKLLTRALLDAVTGATEAGPISASDWAPMSRGRSSCGHGDVTPPHSATHLSVLSYPSPPPPASTDCLGSPRPTSRFMAGAKSVRKRQTFHSIPCAEALWEQALALECEGACSTALEQYGTELAAATADWDEATLQTAHAGALKSACSAYMSAMLHADGQTAADGLRKLREACDAHCREVLQRMRAMPVITPGRSKLNLKGHEAKSQRRITVTEAVLPQVQAAKQEPQRRCSSDGVELRRPRWHNLDQGLLPPESRLGIDQSSSLRAARACFAFAPRTDDAPPLRLPSIYRSSSANLVQPLSRSASGALDARAA